MFTEKCDDGKRKGYVVDVSDFLKTKEDSKWRDLEKAYFTFYFPFIYKLPFSVKIPYFMLNIVRRSYRKYKKLKRTSNYKRTTYVPENELNSHK